MMLATGGEHNLHRHRLPADRSDRRSGLLLGGVIAAVAAAALSGDGTESGTILCPFRRCTGAYCPGCGGTRAVGRLLRGDIVGAWHQHPYVVLLAVQSIVLGVAWLSDAGRTVVRRVWLPVLIANVAAMAAIWVFRLAIGDIPGF